MERNCRFMKGLAGCVALLVLICSRVEAAQQAPGANLPPVLFGSVSQGAPSGAPIALSIGDAIDRALRYNLGTVISEQETRVSRAARVRALSELLPKVTGEVSETIQQINLAAFGFASFPGIPTVVGPFSVFDSRAR